MMKKMLTSLWPLCLVASAMGATIRVPADVSTIQGGIDVAVNGDTVLLSDGVFTGDGNRDIDFGGKLIVVRSVNGPVATIIDCEGSAEEPHRGFFFHNNEDSTARIEGLTIRNGQGRYLFDTNYTRGGAVLCSAAAPVISRCQFTRNSADFGGAVYLFFANAKMINCDFIENTALIGGGLCTSISDSRVDSCSFMFNTGSSISYTNGTHELRFTVFRGNTSTQGGGAIRFRKASAIIHHTLFDANSALESGGAISCNESSPYISGVTFIGNAAPLGGGIYCHYDAHPIIIGSIIAFSQEGGAIACGAPYNAPGLLHCDVYGNAGGDWVDCIEDQAWRNFSADPLFCNPESGDFRLQSISPCIADSIGESWNVGAFNTGCYVCGDADGDGVLTVGDIAAMTDLISGAGDCQQPCEASDTDCDRFLTLLDIMNLANHLFQDGPEPICPWDWNPAWNQPSLFQQGINPDLTPWDSRSQDSLSSSLPP